MLLSALKSHSRCQENITVCSGLFIFALIKNIASQTALDMASATKLHRVRRRLDFGGDARDGVAEEGRLWRLQPCWRRDDGEESEALVVCINTEALHDAMQTLMNAARMQNH